MEDQARKIKKEGKAQKTKKQEGQFIGVSSEEGKVMHTDAIQKEILVANAPWSQERRTRRILDIGKLSELAGEKSNEKRYRKGCPYLRFKPAMEYSVPQ